MNQYSALLDDGLVTEDEVDLATSDHPFAPYPSGPDQDTVEDDLNLARGLIAPTPRTVKEGLANLARMRHNNIPIGGVGLCLYDVRWFCWGINAVWPTAEQAGLHGTPIHRFNSFNDIPRGMSIIFENANVWHISVALGAGLNNTSDLHRNGYNGVATIERTYGWCGATDWYGIETVNTVDVYPNPHKKPIKPTAWSLERRLEFLRNEARRQREDGHLKRAAQLAHWADTLKAKLG